MRHEAADLAAARWQLWFEDSFDRHAPRQIEASGVGLRRGLAQLWARHLGETVQEDGRLGFSRFNLWWSQPEISIEIAGDRRGQQRLRQWVCDSPAAPELLLLIAAAHERLLLEDRESELTALAATAANYTEFIARLSELVA